MIDNISGLQLFGVAMQPDGSVGLTLEQRYAAMVYFLDLDQAEALGKSLIEMVAASRP
jgi:hypothetical protein